MTPTEEIDLARANVIRELAAYMLPMGIAEDIARAIRESDTARGLVVVPVELIECAIANTERHPLMAGFAHHDPTRKELEARLWAVRADLQAMLAASPYAETTHD